MCSLPRRVRRSAYPWRVPVLGVFRCMCSCGFRIRSFQMYALPRESPEMFRQLRVGEQGTDVVWTDEIDIAADTLWRPAREQAGDAITADAFRH